MRALHVAPLFAAALCSASSLFGCQQSSPAAPGFGNSAASRPVLGAVLREADQELGVLAVYRVHLDVGTFAATSELLASREGQGANNNDSIYLLDIAKFMERDTFKVRGITRTATTLDVRYTVTHPFAGPSDPRGVPNASNRSDLGITGMALFLLDAPADPGNIFFDDGAGSRVVANTSLLTNPDAYYQPAGLMATTGTANTFPFKVLVDETGPDGSREGISNGGLVTGNYGTDGWTLDELGSSAPFNQWTGYGLLHQGQASTSTASFDLALVQALGNVSLDVAIIAKYPDPRAGSSSQAKRANRLPNDNGDATDSQAYRMPHGCSDVPVITQLPAQIAGQFTANEITSDTFVFAVQDWDARAFESPNLDLSQDIIVTNVAQGESGLPGFEICLPGVLSETVADAGVNSQRIITPFTAVTDDDTFWGGDIAVDSGMPGDALVYQFEVTKGLSTVQTEGTYTGMVRAIDPEELLGTGQIAVALDGTTLAPLTSNLPHNITYQSFTVFMDELPPPTGCIPPALPFVGTPVGVQLTPVHYQSNTPPVPPPTFPYNTQAVMDSAAFPDTRFTPGGGVVAAVPYHNNSGINQPIQFYLDIINNNAGAINLNTYIQLTNFPAMPQIVQVECDSTGRILFVGAGPSWPRGDIFVSPYASPNQKYLTGPAGPLPNIFWFDPVTPPAQATSYNTIDTAGLILVAMTVDRAGNIYGVDQSNVLHMWEKATGYSQDPTTLGFPKDLSTFPEIGPPSVRRIHDLVYNEYNKQFLMLWQQDSNSASIVRLDCDLEGIASSTPGTYGSINWTKMADIGMDQVSTSGVPLAGQGEAQLFTCSQQYAGIKIWNASTLTEYQSAPWAGGYTYFAIDIALNGCPVGPSGNWTGCVLGMSVPAGGPNAGWQ